MRPSALNEVDKATVLRRSWLSAFPEAVAADAAACCKARIVSDGTLVHACGASADGFYTIASGSVRFTRTTADGHAMSIAVFEASNWFGEISMFDRLPRTHDSHALGRTILLFHARTDFKRLLARRLLELTHLQPSMMNAEMVPGGRDVPLTLEEIGNLLGKSCQSSAKLLRQWEQTGLVETKYGAISIRQPQALNRIAYPERVTDNQRKLAHTAQHAPQSRKESR